MPSKDLNCLKEPFQTAVRTLIDLCQDIPDFRVAETCRTLAEQKEKVRLGYSKTLKSKHLIGEAVDIYVRAYDMALYNQVYEKVKNISYIIYPYYDLNWGWDAMHFQFDPNKKVEEVSMTAGDQKTNFKKLSPRDQHFIACYWAYLSIKRKEPTDDKVWKLVDKYPDIQELRKVLLKEMCDKEHPCFVGYSYNGSKTQDCRDELEEQKIAYEKHIVSIRDELESKLQDCQKIVKDRQGIYEVCEGKLRNRWWYFKKFWEIK